MKLTPSTRNRPSHQIKNLKRLGFYSWDNLADDPHYQYAKEVQGFFPDFPVPVYIPPHEDFLCIAIAEQVWAGPEIRKKKIFFPILKRALTQTSQLWWETNPLRWETKPRKLLENGEYKITYKNCKIYFSVLNGGILAAWLIPPDSKTAWSLPSERLGLNVYIDEYWHIERCKEKIDELFPDSVPQ